MKRQYRVALDIPGPKSNIGRRYVGKIVTDNDMDEIPVMLDEGAVMPCRAHDPDAGADLFSREEVTICSGKAYVFDTGVHMAIPYGYAGFVKSKSGLNVNHNLVSEGVVDAGYTGSIRVKLYNLGKEPYTVHVGDKISQIVILPVELCGFRQVSRLEETERGNGGFGSTGR